MSRLKKTVTVLSYLLFALTVLYPVGVLSTALAGYRFEPVSLPVFVCIVAVLSLFVAVFYSKYEPENKGVSVLLAVITPLSLINAVFCVYRCPCLVVLAGVILASACCCSLTVSRGRPSALKVVSLVLSGITVVPMLYSCFFSLLFSYWGTLTVIKTVESPNGQYYAEVIESNQGALGGESFRFGSLLLRRLFLDALSLSGDAVLEKDAGRCSRNSRSVGGGSAFCRVEMTGAY